MKKQDYFNNRWKHLPPEAPESTEPAPILSANVPAVKEEKKESGSKPLKTSTSTSSLRTFKPVDDDDQIDLLLLNVNEKLSQLQQYSQELMSLRYPKVYTNNLTNMY